MPKKIYITTSIPYVNAEPHIGFALELAQADTVARYFRNQLGKDQVRFINGTDEHGSKIEKTAAEKGMEPQKFVDEISAKFIDLGKDLNITNDDFVRTSSERHKKSATELWNRCKKDIYKKNYHGLYCSGCEEFKTEKELIDGLCPTHKIKPEEVNEENYFFALSKYAEQIQELIASDKLKITPEIRKNEVLGWLKEGVGDVSVSRDQKKLSWGVPVPGDDSQTMYVWVDALSNYITGAGFPDSKYQNWWNEDVTKIHIIGKDILRFHALIWPGLLLSAGLPLPNIIYTHGHITADNQKMSKSLGNVIDPFTIIEKYGADPLRYYLLAKIPYDGDGDFSIEKFKAVYKGELADGLGNLVNRILHLARSNEIVLEPDKNKLVSNATAPIDEKTIDQKIESFKFDLTLGRIWQTIKYCNELLSKEKPWEYAKNDRKKLADFLQILSENVFRTVSLLKPFLPETAEEAINQLKSGEPKPLFPQID